MVDSTADEVLEVWYGSPRSHAHSLDGCIGGISFEPQRCGRCGSILGVEQQTRILPDEDVSFAVIAKLIYVGLYGAAITVVVALLQGHSFALPAVASWWLSLFYLALAGSVLTFACFLTLQERIGPGPTASIGVMTPLLALLVSLVFENFQPDLLTFTGAALAVAGNVMMLRRA